MVLTMIISQTGLGRPHYCRDTSILSALIILYNMIFTEVASSKVNNILHNLKN